MFKPYEIFDERERLEVEHELYLQSPELRIYIYIFDLLLIRNIYLELNDLLHQAAFKGGLTRSLSLSSDMMKKLSHKQVKKKPIK